MSVEPGWYTDPYDDSKIRFWDGGTWTEQSAPRGSMPGAEAPTGVLPAQEQSGGQPSSGEQAQSGTGAATGSLYGSTPEHAPSAAETSGAAATSQLPAHGGPQQSDQFGQPQQGGPYGPGGSAAGSPPVAGSPGAYGAAAGFGASQGGPGNGAPQAGPGYVAPQGGPGYGAPQGGPGYGSPQAGPGYGAPQGGPGQGAFGAAGGYGGAGGPGGPGGPGAQGGGPEKKRNPALVALLVLLGVAIVGVGGYVIYDATAGEDDTTAETTPPPATTPGGETAPPTTGTDPTLPPPEEQPTTEEPTEVPTEDPTTEEPTTEEPTTEEPTLAPGEFVGNGETAPAMFIGPDGEELGTRFESAIADDDVLRLTLRIDERSAVILGGHSPEGEDLRFAVRNADHDYTGDDSYELMDVFGFEQGYYDPATAWVMDPGEYEFTMSEYGGDASQIVMEVHSGSLVVGVPSDTPVTIEEGRPSVFILQVGEETPLRAGIHGDEDTVIHVVDPELYVYQNDDAPIDHDARNWHDASVDIDSMPVGDSVIVASTYWGDNPTDAVVHIAPR